MEFYLDGILQSKVKANYNSKHNWVFNVNLIQTFTSIYLPITKWLLNLVSKPFMYKNKSKSLLMLPYQFLAFNGGDTFMGRSFTR